MPGIPSFPRSLTVHAEHPVPGGRRLRVDLAVAGAAVPGLLLLPERAGAGRAAAALLLHGYASRKELMAETIGTSLLAQGMASLAIDLPLHGERDAPIQEQAMRNPLELMRQWRLALRETGVALRALGEVPGVDRGRLGLVGYSMGAFVAVLVAADEPAARAVVLAAGGDLPDRTPLSALIRRVADPLRAVRRFHGRPLLMINGRYDTTITPAQAERLYAAAGEPKALRWWNTGHYLPPAAIDDGARWLHETLVGARRASAGNGEG